MNVEAWARTDVGRVRKRNEDGWLIDEGLGLFAVADGMGGHSGGDIASALALRTVRDELDRRRAHLERARQEASQAAFQAVQRELEISINVACSSIFQRAEGEGKRGMGTTLSLLLMVGSKAVMAHVGDSRVYMSRRRVLHQLSEDHSYLREQVKKGFMTEEEASRSRFSNVITRAVGITETVQVDTLLLDVVPGDVFLLCSDGLHGSVKDPEELAQVLHGGRTDEAATRLVDVANARGGRDNITCVVVRVPGSDDDPSTLDVLERIDVLRDVSLFKHLTYKELVIVLNETQQRTVEAGDLIIGEGSEAEEFFVILEGEVEVSKGGHTLTHLGPRVHFGEMALVDRSPRSASVRARMTTRLLALERRALFELVRKEPVLASKLLWSLVQVLSHRLRSANEALYARAPETSLGHSDVGGSAPIPNPIGEDL